MVDVERQIRQMADFIELEAKEKAAEIRAKAKADADAEKQVAVANAKAKLADEYDRKEKALAVEQRIAASMAEARQRKRLLAAREEFVQKLAGEAKSRLGVVAASNAQAYNVLLKGLIKQAILRLEGEKTVEVHARPQDLAVAQKAAQAAAVEVAAELKAAGASQAVTATAVADASLAGSAGGVVVWALNGRIKCNNTLEARLDVALHDLTPVIRDTLFPSARAPVLTKPLPYFPHLEQHGSKPAAAPAAPAAPAAAPVVHAAPVAAAPAPAAAAPAAPAADPFAF